MYIDNSVARTKKMKKALERACEGAPLPVVGAFAVQLAVRAAKMSGLQKQFLISLLEDEWDGATP